MTKKQIAAISEEMLRDVPAPDMTHEQNELRVMTANLGVLRHDITRKMMPNDSAAAKALAKIGRAIIALVAAQQDWGIDDK
jgi:hypothetical protein